MRASTLFLAFALLALPAAAQEQAVPHRPDRQVSVELTPWSTTLRVVEDGQVVDLREVSTPDLPCGVVEQLGASEGIWAEAKKPKPPTGPQVVDVLVLYSSTALQEIGSRELVIALAESFIGSMNQDIYPGSGVTNLTLRLVGVVSAPWFREADAPLTHKALTKSLKKYGADVFLVLSGELEGVCGWGATLVGGIVRWDCGLGTVSHELGHIFIQGLHDLCFVQCAPERHFATIECEDASKIPPGCLPESADYYSNVTKLLFGLPMGDASHNSAKAVMASAHKVAAIRKPKKPKSSR
ncbi:MAG TPA: hypothetical protein VN493_06035 [Thermoanaerobaculia bacterium]|nr:hypothetical protein [Thermoanaerobaculia bacterium]